MSLIYVLIAIAFGGAQYFFVYLANRQGRNDALQKTEENLVSIFQNLDSTSKKEFLLNADLKIWIKKMSNWMVLERRPPV